jgi:hypothetical protein
MWRIANPKTGKGTHEIPIHLDENGDSIVCEDIWNYLQEAHHAHFARNEFVILNEILDPPTLVLGSENKRVKHVKTMRDNGVSEAHLLAVAQTFAPKGVKPRITYRRNNG